MIEKTPARLLVIKLGALGDFVLATGAFAAIRNAHPDDQITLLTTAPYAEIAEASRYFDEVWIDERPSRINLISIHWWYLGGLSLSRVSEFGWTTDDIRSVVKSNLTDVPRGTNRTK